MARPKAKVPMIGISFRIPKTLRAALDELACSRGVNFADLGREALESLVARKRPK